VERCRLLAKEALALIRPESPTLRPYYEGLAAEWTALADEIVAEIN